MKTVDSIDALQTVVRSKAIVALGNGARPVMEDIYAEKAKEMLHDDTRFAKRSNFKAKIKERNGGYELDVWSVAKPRDSIFGQKIRSGHETIFAQWVNDGEWFNLKKWFEDGMPFKGEYKPKEYRLPARKFIRAAQQKVNTTDDVLNGFQKHFFK